MLLSIKKRTIISIVSIKRKKKMKLRKKLKMSKMV
jgi:hypothetical protein